MVKFFFLVIYPIIINNMDIDGDIHLGYLVHMGHTMILMIIIYICVYTVSYTFVTGPGYTEF